MMWISKEYFESWLSLLDRAVSCAEAQVKRQDAIEQSQGTLLAALNALERDVEQGFLGAYEILNSTTYPDNPKAREIIDSSIEREKQVLELVSALSGKLDGIRDGLCDEIAKLGSDIRDGIINECEEIRRRDKKVELWQRKSDLYRDQRDKLLQEATSQPPRKRKRNR